MLSILILIIISAWTIWAAYQAVVDDIKVRKTHLDDDLIDDFFRGRLRKDKRLRKRITKHLSTCEACQNRLHEIRIADNAKMKAKKEAER